MSNIGKRNPIEVPIDWFHPSYFDDQDLAFTGSFIHSLVALPGDLGGRSMENWETWIKMEDKEFMDTYGLGIRKTYPLPKTKDMRNVHPSMHPPVYDDDEDELPNATPMDQS